MIALAHRDPDSQTVCLILDATTANTAIFAIAAHADEREAHVREVEQFGQNLPEGSYGRRNRQAIAARETRVAARLRAVERAYRIADERDTRSSRPSPPDRALIQNRRPTGRSNWSRERPGRSHGADAVAPDLLDFDRYAAQERVCLGEGNSSPVRFRHR